MKFKAFRVAKTDAGFERSIIERSESDLPEGELLISVKYSSLNFKDGLSVQGVPGLLVIILTRQELMPQV